MSKLGCRAPGRGRLRARIELLRPSTRSSRGDSSRCAASAARAVAMHQRQRALEHVVPLGGRVRAWHAEQLAQLDGETLRRRQLRGGRAAPAGDEGLDVGRRSTGCCCCGSFCLPGDDPIGKPGTSWGAAAVSCGKARQRIQPVSARRFPRRRVKKQTPALLFLKKGLAPSRRMWEKAAGRGKAGRLTRLRSPARPARPHRPPFIALSASAGPPGPAGVSTLRWRVPTSSSSSRLRCAMIFDDLVDHPAGRSRFQAIMMSLSASC